MPVLCLWYLGVFPKTHFLFLHIKIAHEYSGNIYVNLYLKRWNWKINSNIRQQQQKQLFLCNKIPVQLHIKISIKILKEYWSTLVRTYDFLPVTKSRRIFGSIHVVFLTYLFYIIVPVWSQEFIHWTNVLIYVNIHVIPSDACLWDYNCIFTYIRTLVQCINSWLHTGTII